MGINIDKTVSELSEISKRITNLQDRQKVLKEVLQKEMKDQHMEKIENAAIRIQYVKGFDRNGIDQKKLTDLYPEVAAICQKRSTVNDSLKVTLL